MGDAPGVRVRRVGRDRWSDLWKRDFLLSREEVRSDRVCFVLSLNVATGERDRGEGDNEQRAQGGGNTPKLGHSFVRAKTGDGINLGAGLEEELRNVIDVFINILVAK